MRRPLVEERRGRNVKLIGCKEDTNEMNRKAILMSTMLFVAGAGGGTLSLAGSQALDPASEWQVIRTGWVEAERGEYQAPRAATREDESGAARSREVQAPRADTVQAPRAEDAKAPRSSESEPPRWRED